MPHMPAIDIALVMHLRDHGCQPFPFGSVVPRWLTAPAGSSLLWLDPAHRARVASKLVLAEYLRTRAVTMSRPISKLPGLIAEVAQEWSSRHPELDPTIHQAEGLHSSSPVPAAALLHTLMALGRAQDGTATNEHAAKADFIKRLTQRHTKLTPKTQKKHADKRVSTETRQRATPFAKLPFSAPTYRCQCQPPAALPPAKPLADAAVDQVLAMPRGGWVLLGLFFLKQLHGHLAWPPNKDPSYKSAQKKLYEAALLALNALARSRSDALHAPTAAGLALVLPMLAPPFDRVEGADAALPDDLPACFRPLRLEPADDAALQARRLLCAQPGLAEQVLAVDVLAREVAAQLTCPVGAPHLDLKQAYFQQTKEYHEKNHKTIRRSLLDGMPIVVLATPQFVRDHLLFRIKRLRAYNAWMALTGLKESVKAQEATLRQPPLPATPGRPLEEEVAP